MATGGHVLQQQKGSVEARIKSLVNNDLKEICRAYSYQVSGTKPALQNRCIEILNDIVNRGDKTAFDELNYRVANHGQGPPRSASYTAADMKSRSHSDNPYYNGMPPARAPQNGTSRLASGRTYFKKSPFYDGHQTVLPLTDLPEFSKPEMPQNRHTVKSVITLTPDVVQRLKSDPAMKLLLYCGSIINQYQVVDVAFPNQLEVKLNGDDVRGNFKGLKNKPGSTKPTDITDKVRKVAGYQNQLHVTYALTQKRFSFAVYLVRYVSADVLTARIKDGLHGGGIITKQQVLKEMNQANADPDIAATSVRMSLKDPISTLRISLPVRSTRCTHNQCFDGSMFMQLQDQAPQWACPVCSKAVDYESLCVDKYFEEILQKTAKSIEKVDIEPNGEWHVIKEDEAQPKGHSSRDNRAAYDDDFDDDIVEVSDPSSRSRPTNGVPIGNSFTPSLLSPMPALNTPPLSSRGPSAAPSAASVPRGEKRAASSVIDLTLSDDEDELPRSAKRQSTNTSTQPSTSTNSYSTPSSLPDPRASSSYYGGQSHGADSFRPVVSSIARPPSSTGRNSAAPEFGSHFGNNGFARGSDSPFRAGNSSSPSFSVNSTGNNWSSRSRPSAPSTPAFQPFAIRPLQQSQQSQQHQQQPPIRLPPMNAHPPDRYGNAWRSDQNSSYSHSPPGS